MNPKIWRVRWYLPESRNIPGGFKDSFFACKDSALRAVEEVEGAIEKLGGPPQMFSGNIRRLPDGKEISDIELTEFELHP